MKILALSDIHMRDFSPVWRVDDYYEEQFKKLEWVINLGNEKGCELFLQAGDFFDYSTDKINYDMRSKQFQIKRISFKTISRCSDILSNFNGEKLSIVGQHDQRARDTSLDNTPIRILYSSGVIKQLSSSPYKIGNVHIYGLNFGEEIPKIESADAFNVLVAHVMVIDQKLWATQTEYENSAILLAKNKFDLIISGDNHKFIEYHLANRHLFNLGSLMRMTSAQMDHCPKCLVFDTDSREYEVIEIPVSPSSVVFDVEGIQQEKKKKEENKYIKEFLNSLADDSIIDIDFKSNMENYLLTNKIGSDIVNIIYKCMGVQCQ